MLDIVIEASSLAKMPVALFLQLKSLSLLLLPYWVLFGYFTVGSSRSRHLLPRKSQDQPCSARPFNLNFKDLQSLKAWSLACYSWYIAVVPYLHRTFVFTRVGTSKLKLLLNRHALGFLPFVKEMTILQQCNDYSWFLPRFFLHRDSHLFFAFTNVQSLTVESLEIIPELNRYFGHLSPTLRSFTLHIPNGTPRHLSHFISLFPNLKDVKIRSLIHPGLGVPDDTLVPFSAPKFEGRLTLLLFAAEVDETWEQLATSTFVTRVVLQCKNISAHCIRMFPELIPESVSGVVK